MVHPIVKEILERVGVSRDEEIRDFLYPKLKDLPSPQKMYDLSKGAAIVGEAILAKYPILIWGDYDVDGTTATALLLRFFAEIGYTNVEYYIPNRLNEGYGLRPESLKRVCSKTKREQKKILITVDNGISAQDGVGMAKQLGYTVVVTDHHLAPKERVQADAVINPMQKQCAFPETSLAGVGVAFYLVIAIRAYLITANYTFSNGTPPNLKQFLGLVALGTVADLVPMTTINRILVRGGFESIANQDNVGIASLCKTSSIDQNDIRSEDVAFLLAPKINAAGRLGNVDLAIELLTGKDTNVSLRLATELSDLNESRKLIVMNDIVKATNEQCDLFYIGKSVVIAAGDFHIGVAGIVASKLVDVYSKPSFVLCTFGKIYKGSARSIEGINIFKVLADCEQMLCGYGGHAMAAGMSVNKDKLHVLTKLLDKNISQQIEKKDIEQSDKVCFEFSINEVFEDSLLKQLLLLEPHGVGNPQPVFCDHRVGLSKIKRIGKDKTHLSFTINNGSTGVYGVGFGLGELYDNCLAKGPKSIHYTPTLNFFNGQPNWQARVVAIEHLPTDHTGISI